MCCVPQPVRRVFFQLLPFNFLTFCQCESGLMLVGKRSVDVWRFLLRFRWRRSSSAAAVLSNKNWTPFHSRAALQCVVDLLTPWCLNTPIIIFGKDHEVC